MSEKRQFVRVGFHQHAQLHVNGKAYKVELENISLKGVLIFSPEVMPIQHGDSVTLHLPMIEGEKELLFNAELVHREMNDYGFKFTTMEVGVMADLRRLMELNTGDEEEIRKELSFLVE